jgi:D-alanyl-D-alanine carboxypeptidase
MKNLKFTITLLITILLVQSCSKNEKTTPTDPIVPVTNVQTLLDEIKDDFNTGGVVAATRKDDGTMDFGVLGNSEDMIPLSRTMSLGIGSNTKTFTAALIFKLIEEDQLSIDDNLNDLLPEKVNSNLNGNITVKQLLNHSSGLFDPLNENDDFIDSVFANPSYSYTIDEYLEKVLAPYFVNGLAHSYSNTNYMLLGLIIEKKTGKTYHEYLREKILAPLNLSHTFLSGKEPSNNTVGYSWGPSGNNLKDFPRNGIESIAWSAGSIFSTVEDMAIWYHSLFNGDFLSASSLAAMQTTVAGANALNYGSGIFKNTNNGSEVFFHSGQTIAYNSFCIYDVASKGIAIVIINQTENDAEQVALKILDILKE